MVTIRRLIPAAKQLLLLYCISFSYVRLVDSCQEVSEGSILQHA